MSGEDDSGSGKGGSRKKPGLTDTIGFLPEPVSEAELRELARAQEEAMKESERREYLAAGMALPDELLTQQEREAREWNAQQEQSGSQATVSQTPGPREGATLGYDDVPLPQPPALPETGGQKTTLAFGMKTIDDPAINGPSGRTGDTASMGSGEVVPGQEDDAGFSLDDFDEFDQGPLPGLDEAIKRAAETGDAVSQRTEEVLTHTSVVTAEQEIAGYPGRRSIVEMGVTRGDEELDFQPPAHSTVMAPDETPDVTQISHSPFNEEQAGDQEVGSADKDGDVDSLALPDGLDGVREGDWESIEPTRAAGGVYATAAKQTREPSGDQAIHEYRQSRDSQVGPVRRDRGTDPTMSMPAAAKAVAPTAIQKAVDETGEAVISHHRGEPIMPDESGVPQAVPPPIPLPPVPKAVSRPDLLDEVGEKYEGNESAEVTNSGHATSQSPIVHKLVRSQDSQMTPLPPAEPIAKPISSPDVLEAMSMMPGGENEGGKPGYDATGRVTGLESKPIPAGEATVKIDPGAGLVNPEAVAKGIYFSQWKLRTIDGQPEYTGDKPEKKAASAAGVGIVAAGTLDDKVRGPISETRNAAVPAAVHTESVEMDPFVSAHDFSEEELGPEYDEMLTSWLRRNWVYVAAGVLGVVALGLGTYVLYKHYSSKSGDRAEKRPAVASRGPDASLSLKRDAGLDAAVIAQADAAILGKDAKVMVAEKQKDAKVPKYKQKDATPVVAVKHSRSKQPTVKEHVKPVKPVEPSKPVVLKRPVTPVKPQSIDGYCEMQAQFKFDSVNYKRRETKSAMESYLAKIASAGHKTVYVHGFAGPISYRGWNLLTKYNVELSNRRSTRAWKDIVKLAVKYGLKVVNSGGHGEIIKDRSQLATRSRKDIASGSRLAVLTTTDTRYKGQSIVAMEQNVSGHHVLEAYGNACDAPTKTPSGPTGEMPDTDAKPEEMFAEVIHDNGVFVSGDGSVNMDPQPQTYDDGRTEKGDREKKFVDSEKTLTAVVDEDPLDFDIDVEEPVTREEFDYRNHIENLKADLDSYEKKIKANIESVDFLIDHLNAEQTGLSSQEQGTDDDYYSSIEVEGRSDYVEAGTEKAEAEVKVPWSPEMIVDARKKVPEGYKDLSGEQMIYLKQVAYQTPLPKDEKRLNARLIAVGSDFSVEYGERLSLNQIKEVVLGKVDNALENVVEKAA